MQSPFLGWKSFVDKFPDPIARYDKAYKHLYINQAIANEISLCVSDVIGKSNRDLKIPNDEVYLAELEEKIQAVFDSGKATVNYTQHEFPDETRYYFMKLIPEFEDHSNQNGEVQSVWAVTRDITHLKQTEINFKQAEENLQKQNLELSQLNADLDTFFFTVSHDMRGPLQNINGIVQILKAGLAEEIPTLTQMLEKETQRFSNVLTGLTEILELKNIPDQAEKVELHSVLQEVLAELKGLMEQTQATVTADFSDCPTLRYSAPYLESLFRNLISNALKYRLNGRLPHIQIRAKKEESFVTLLFKDNGQGIDLTSNKEKIFMPFYQIDGNQEGKGMGLNIVQRILERNGGKIEVQSQLGSGTTFICYLKEIN